MRKPNLRDEVQDLAAWRELLDRAMQRVGYRLFNRRRMAGADEDHLALCQAFIDTADARHIAPHLRQIRRARLPIARAVSFTQILLQQSELRRLGTRPHVWRLDDKLSAYRFADRVGVRRPTSDQQVYSLDSLPRTAPCVVKPTRSTGSRGCFLVHRDDDMIHLLDGSRYGSWEELLAAARTLMLDPPPGRRRVEDRWMVEELILEADDPCTPARNLKFYTFFGEVPLIQEVRRGSELEICFWLPDGRPTSCGRYQDAWFEGDGIEPEHIAQVAQLSRQIPAPFVRIDMLQGQQGLVLGEFTPVPGRSNDFDDHWDRLLGEAWLRAQHRIVDAVLSGERFEAFSAAASPS